MSIAPEHIPTDDCYRCGYDLRGITNDRPCPECGLLAARSRRASDELHDSRPRWLRSLARGVWLMLLALVLLFACPSLLEQTRYWSHGRWGFRNSGWIIFGVVPLAVLAIPACVFLLGALNLTAREHYGPADRTDRNRRRWIRILAAMPLLGVACEGLLMWWSLSARTRWYATLGWDTFGIALVVLLACIPLPALLFYQLRSLAKRARSAHLAEHCAIVGIGTSIAVSYATAVVILFQFAEDWGVDPEWTSRSPVSLVLILLCSLSASLFAIWSFYLLIRFAIAFHSAACQLSRKWKADDRSEAVF